MVATIQELEARLAEKEEACKQAHRDADIARECANEAEREEGYARRLLIDAYREQKACG